MLYLIPTPIGNKGDITIRSLELLRSLSIFFCEDTRTTKDLFRLYDIPYAAKKLYSLTSYTGETSAAYYLDMAKNQDVGLVSEAGTPGLSDPGKMLLLACQQSEIPFTILPGANALVPAIVAAGFPTHEFHFLGFLPSKKGRQTALQNAIMSAIPVFFYESVHRMDKLLAQLGDLGFTGKMSIAREISKMFEQYITGTLVEIQVMVAQKKLPMKGEFVVGIRNSEKGKVGSEMKSHLGKDEKVVENEE